VLLVLAGGLGSCLAALGIAHGNADASQKSFVASSTEISSALQLSIRHEADLIVSAGGYVVGAPNASNAQFAKWADAVHALGRYPELEGLGHSVIVPAAQLASFAARSAADPPGPLSSGGTFQVTPPGSRSFYCLSESDFARSPQAEFPAGFDF
jgi:hypothetical protein